METKKRKILGSPSEKWEQDSEKNDDRFNCKDIKQCY